jgi:hypothetical protein
VFVKSRKFVVWASMVIGLVVIAAGLVCCAAPAAKNVEVYEAREGDVIFQSLPEGPVVAMIEGATGSRYSHCGIVAWDGEGWVVWEALGKVHATPMKDFLGRGREGFYEVYRFKPGEDKELAQKVVAGAKGYAGREYDFRYRMDDENIYCSELIYKAYQGVTGKPVGKLVKVKELNWRPYEKTIRMLEGDGSLPLEREMITPRDLAGAGELERVYSTEVGG